MLIVDDKAEPEAFFKDVLEQEGFRVTVETRARFALTLAEDRCFDAVIVDMEMSLAGLNLVTFLRHRVPDTPVILITGVDATFLSEAALTSNASRCLEKPVGPVELVDAVRSVLGRDDRRPPVTLPAGPADGLDVEPREGAP